MSNDMTCPFCSSSVPEGFSVCSGCGANYRSNPAGVFRGLVSGFFTVVFGAWGVNGWDGFFLIAAVFALFTFMQFSSISPRWYRRNV